MKTFPNYIKLLGKMDYRKEAWKTSRPKFTEENLHFDRISEMDLSLNSMLVYTFEVRSSVIFRDLVFSLRPMEGWALSTRSMPINIDTLRLSSEFADNHGDYARVKKMFNDLDEGVSRDNARGVLPCTLSTVYTFTIDYRVLISFVKNLKIISRVLYIEYGIPLLVAAGITKEEYKSSTIRSSIEYYEIVEEERIDGIKRIGNIILGHYEMKMSLASQFLRQHYSKVKIGLWNMCDDYLNIELNQSDPVEIVFYTDVNSYYRLMSMRSHWVIDWSQDMWGGIVGDFVKNMSSEEFWNFIPNGAGKPDPYWADVYNRVLREDPGTPCPIMCEWPDMLEKKREEVGDSILMDKYIRLVKDGYIKDNPDNEHRKKYLELGDLL